MSFFFTFFISFTSSSHFFFFSLPSSIDYLLQYLCSQMKLGWMKVGLLFSPLPSLLLPLFSSSLPPLGLSSSSSRRARLLFECPLRTLRDEEVAASINMFSEELLPFSSFGKFPSF
jgi:hypothetical protein